MKQQGYTLIEILVVLFIISIVTSVALLSIKSHENKQMEEFANEITEIMTLAEEQALLEPTVLGLAFAEHHFQFANLAVAEKNKKNNWLPVQDGVLGKHVIPDNIQISIEVSNTRLATNQEETEIHPQIVISTNGEITPFTIYVGKKGAAPRYAITGDANGNIKNKFLYS